MPTVPLSDELAQAALDLVEKYGSPYEAARATGGNYSAVRHRYDVALKRGMVPTKPERREQSDTGQGVLVIPDSHSPFMHPDALAFLTEAKERLKPTRVIHLGDEADNHAISQWDPDPDGYSAGHELQECKLQLKPLFALFPLVSVCESNHGVRPLKKAYRAGIPKAWIRDYREALEAPAGWQWADRWEIDGVVYQHGEGFGGETAHKKWAVANGKSTVIGHIHSHAGIAYIKSEYRQIFGMNCGCLIDATTYAFKYAKHSAHKPVLGVGFVDNGSPFYFPMRLDKDGRWTGKW